MNRKQFVAEQNLAVAKNLLTQATDAPETIADLVSRIRNLEVAILYLAAHRQEVPWAVYEAVLAAFRERMDDPDVIVVRPRTGDVVHLPPAGEVLRAVLACMRTLGAGRPLFVADIRATFPRTLWAKDLSNLDRLAAWLICHQGVKVDGAALHHIGEGTFELSEAFQRALWEKPKPRSDR